LPVIWGWRCYSFSSGLFCILTEVSLGCQQDSMCTTEGIYFSSCLIDSCFLHDHPVVACGKKVWEWFCKAKGFLPLFFEVSGLLK
jgi:hypothetical protein